MLALRKPSNIPIAADKIKMKIPIRIIVTMLTKIRGGYIYGIF